MGTFRKNLEKEFTKALGGTTSRYLFSGQRPAEGYLNDVHAYLDQYRVAHPGLPWFDAMYESRLGPRKIKEPTTPDEVLERLRESAQPTRISEEYGAVIRDFVDTLEQTFTTLREAPDTSINLLLPRGGGGEAQDGYAERLMHLLAGNGENSIRSLNRELDEGVQSQTTHPIPGTNLFLTVTAFYRKPHERLEHPPRFLGGLKFERRVVTSDNLAPSVKSAFGIRNTEIAA